MRTGTDFLLFTAAAVLLILSAVRAECAPGTQQETAAEQPGLAQIRAEIRLPETPYTDEAGRPLYREPVQVRLEAAAGSQGISRIEWGIYRGGQAAEEAGVLAVSREGKRYGNGGAVWRETGREENRITAMETEITAAEGNGIRIWLRLVRWDGAEIETAESFSVDSTAPGAEFFLRGEENGENSGFFSGPCQGEIRITDRNPDPEATGIRLTRDGEEVALPELKDKGVWQTEETEDGRESSVILDFEQDGEYLLEICAADRTGRVSPTVRRKFVVDTQAPQLTFQMEGEEGDRPSLQAEDDNLKSDSVILTFTGEKSGKTETEAGAPRWDGKSRLLFPAIPSGREWDDCYQVRASAEDLAGNRTEACFFFRINRCGSVYHFPGELEKLRENAGKAVPEFVFCEDNPGPIRGDHAEIRISFNGEIRTLVPEKEYRTEEEGRENTWNLRRYTILPEVFSREGIYQILAESEDLSGNRNATSFTFAVDRTGPLILPLTIRDGETYGAECPEAVFYVKDDLRLKKAEFFLDGKRKTVKKENDRYTLPAGDRKGERQIMVRAEDAAGNVKILTVDFFVSEEKETSGYGMLLLLLPAAAALLAALLRTADFRRVSR
jgi:hypothetical protein